jgi:hypothetical protein
VGDDRRSEPGRRPFPRRTRERKGKIVEKAKLFGPIGGQQPGAAQGHPRRCLGLPEDKAHARNDSQLGPTVVLPRGGEA